MEFICLLCLKDVEEPSKAKEQPENIFVPRGSDIPVSTAMKHDGMFSFWRMSTAFKQMMSASANDSLSAFHQLTQGPSYIQETIFKMSQMLDRQ